MRSLRSLFGEPLDRANRKTVVAVVEVVRAAAARKEVEAPRVAVAVRVRDGRPVVAVRTGTVERSTVAEVGAGKEDAIGGVVASPTNLITVHAVLRRPRPVAVAVEIVQLLLRRHAPIAARMRHRIFGTGIVWEGRAPSRPHGKPPSWRR